MTGCDKCGNIMPQLLLRQNEKGVAGIFHCEKCVGITINNSVEALTIALNEGHGPCKQFKKKNTTH